MELTQSEKLELAALLGGGTPDDMEPAPTWTPRIPQPSRELREYTARHGLRGGHYSYEDGDTAPELDGGADEWEAAPRWQAHVLPSMRDRASVRAELRGMGYGGEGW